MRLFGKVDGSVDRYDRAEWLSMPFDLAWANAVVAGPYYIGAAQTFTPGATASEVYEAGAAKAEVFTAGAIKAEAN